MLKDKPICPGTGLECETYARGLCSGEDRAEGVPSEEALGLVYVGKTWDGVTIVSPVVCYMYRVYLLPEYHVGDGEFMRAEEVDPGATDFVDRLMDRRWADWFRPDPNDGVAETLTKATPTDATQRGQMVRGR